MSKFLAVFESVRARTGMFLQAPTYAAAASFVMGYDLALEGSVLVGFREWLIPRVGSGNNFGWPALVLRLAFPNSVDPAALVVSSAETERHAIEALFQLIGEFDNERDAPDGLRKIYVNYEDWLSAQSWYVPEGSRSDKS